MTTRAITNNTEGYILLTEQDEFMIQNDGAHTVQIMASDDKPADDANGIDLRPGEVIGNVHITGKIWGKGFGPYSLTDDA